MGETASELTGGCACGAVRYRLEREPIFVNNCHCRLCQQQTGSTSVVNAFYEFDALTQLSGDIVQSGVQTGSGGTHAIVRCAECGTALWSHYPRLGTLAAGVRVGTLDEPGVLQPDAAIFVASKMPWVTLPEGIPHFETSYNPAEVLPPERMARLRALIELRAAQAGTAR
jgi:hypothetical protein